MLTLKHIEVVQAVYAAGSVSAAARALDVSQPSVTKVVKHAETVLGFTLFERRKGRLIPTQDTHTLQVEMTDIVDRVQALRRTTVNMRFGRVGSLRISALPSLSLKLIPAAVASFMQSRTDVSFDLQTLHHEDIVRKLYEREADLAVAFEVPSAMPVVARVVGAGELVVLFRRAQMPAAPERLSLHDLAGHDLVSMVRSGPMGHRLSIELNRIGSALREVASARTFYVAGALVRAGVGIAIVDSFTAAAMQDAELDFRPLDPPVAFDVHAIHLESRPLSKLYSGFLDSLTKAAAHSSLA